MGRFWRIQTYFGSLVGHDAQSGQVVSVLPSARRPDFPLLLAYIPEARSDSCFLFSERGGRFWMGAAAEPVDVIGAGLARLACGKIALYDAGSGLWASGLPPGEDPPHLGGVTFTRTVIDDWEQLQLVAVPPGEIPADAARRAGAIEAMLVRPLDLAIIDATAEQDAAALQAVARLAPSHHLEALAASLIASPRAGRSLARLFPEDGLAVTALPALADWVAARDGGQAPGNEAPQSLGAEYDFLTTLGHDGATPSLAYACTALARRSILPRRDLCIVAIARNEGIYLLDWLAYHRAIGVQDVFLYTNDNDDGSDLLLAALARAGAIRWIRNEVGSGNCAQPKAYGHALAVRPETLDYRWALVIDLDELFVPNPALFRSALDFLRWHEAGPCDAIAVNWIFHGPGQAARWREDFVARRFPPPDGAGRSSYQEHRTPQRGAVFHAALPAAVWSSANPVPRLGRAAACRLKRDQHAGAFRPADRAICLDQPLLLQILRGIPLEVRPQPGQWAAPAAFGQPHDPGQFRTRIHGDIRQQA